jgi:hypothetical protein
MSNLNNKQRTLINSALTIIGYWGRTNDINSPTLEGDMCEEVNRYMAEIPDKDYPLCPEDSDLAELLKFLRSPGIINH